MSNRLEIACFSYEAAVIAAKAGAHRIELCEDMLVGGITPPTKTLERIVANTGNVQRFMMIHKLGSSYHYTKRDFTWMMDKIDELHSISIDGFVFGPLDEKNMPDEQRCRELITAAEKKPCTFHRAFDKIENKSEALEILIACGFNRILTSCGEGNAIDFLTELAALNKQAAGRIIILPGGGVRSSNAKQIIDAMGATEIHSSAIVRGSWPDESEIKKLLNIIM